VTKATAEVLRLTSEFQDARRVLLLAEHLRPNPETITRDTKIELAGWKTPSSPVRSIESRALALQRLQTRPAPTRSAREIALRRREEGDG